MRRLLVLIIAAAPTLAFAEHNTTLPSNIGQRPVEAARPLPTPSAVNTLGNGNNGRSNGDVTGPGDHSRVDTSVNGPLDDRTPGDINHSDDVPQSAHPKPVF
jgi:hypothetical protein